MRVVIKHSEGLMDYASYSFASLVQSLVNEIKGDSNNENARHDKTRNIL